MKESGADVCGLGSHGSASQNKGGARGHLALQIFTVAALLLSAVLGHADSTTYSYDELGRLKKTTYSSGTATTYSFDASGNRVSVTTGPSGLGFNSVEQNTATVSWRAPTNNVGVTGYDYQLNSGSWVSLGNVLTVNLTGLTAGTKYAFAVRARDAVGNPGAATSGSFSTVASTAPGAPSAG